MPQEVHAGIMRCGNTAIRPNQSRSSNKGAGIRPAGNREVDEEIGRELAEWKAGVQRVNLDRSRSQSLADVAKMLGINRVFVSKIVKQTLIVDRQNGPCQPFCNLTISSRRNRA